MPADEIKKAFGQQRLQWIEDDREGWLASNGFYVEAVRAVQDLVARVDSQTTVRAITYSLHAYSLGSRPLNAWCDHRFTSSQPKPRISLCDFSTGVTSTSLASASSVWGLAKRCAKARRVAGRFLLPRALTSGERLLDERPRRIFSRG